MEMIGVPYQKLEEIYSLIQYITDDISEQLENRQTQSYLMTGDTFEQIFNPKDIILDPGVFVEKIEEFEQRKRI